MLSDVDRQVGEAYDVLRDPTEPSPEWARRTTFLIRPDQTIARIYRVADVTGHVEQVLEDLRSEATAATR